MPSDKPEWMAEYLANLNAAYSQSKSTLDETLLQACADLAERVAVLEAQKTALEAGISIRSTDAAASTTAPAPPAKSSSRKPISSGAKASASNSQRGAGAATATATTDGDADADAAAAVARLRLDLAEALRGKTQIQKGIKSVEDENSRLCVQVLADARKIRDVMTEKQSLTVRLRDRDWELREKQKLISDVQDENITLNLQLTMVEKERDKIRVENKSLVSRLLEYKEQEASSMNRFNEQLPR